MAESPSIASVSAEEYLNFEEKSNLRHEYVDGEIFAMTGGTDAHNVICGNLFALLHGHLRGTGCRAYINDMKVQVKAANRFYYPDIMVSCEPFDAKSVFKVSPSLIIEVLSSSTKQIDQREKLVAYRKLDSLKEYVLIHQDKAQLEFYRKATNGQWSATKLLKAGVLELESIPGMPLRILVTEIYSGIDLPHRVKESEEEYEFTP